MPIKPPVGLSATVRVGAQVFRKGNALVWRRWLAMLAGTVALALGVALLILSGVGTGPIDALMYGLTVRTGVGLAVMSLLISMVFILGAWAAGIRPGVGTVISMVAFAPLLAVLVDSAPHAVGEAPHVGWAAAEWGLGALFIACGSALMIVANLGVGAYDAATLAIAKRFRWSIPRSRLLLDVTVAAAAFAVGGPIWVGTVLLAVVMPPLLAVFLRLANRVLSLRDSSGAVEPIRAPNVEVRNGVVADG